MNKELSLARRTQIRELFEELSDLPPGKQDSFLSTIGRTDEALAREVESLLQRMDPAAERFKRLRMHLWREDLHFGQPEKPGTRIGNYTLVDPIGEGGFGMVWLAEQESPVRRQVALKIIKIGMDTGEVVARFESERQALAMMEHPGIATVFDAGETDSGRPYFVMELVHGIPITRYCDEQRLTTPERLRLLVEVSHAIQHAHQKGVIHRDIKPSNILVSTHDGKPVPKIIDFGIAKATSRQLTDKPLNTRLHTFMGTPVYSSPEQIVRAGLDIDTRSDIYSLGVVLYELLTGRLPFDPEELSSAGFEQICKTLREVDPPRPSTQIKSLREAEAVAVAQRRAVDPGKLYSLIRGDIDWIVMHCLEKDRNRRYETANELAWDIERHLMHQPIIARPPTTIYRLGKFVRRNKAVVLSATAVVGVLLLGIAASSWLAVRATQAEQRMAMALKSEAVARMESEALHFDAHAKKLLNEDPYGGNAHGLAHVIAGLERSDSPERRRLALRALWRGPVYNELKPVAHFAPSDGARFTRDGNMLITCSRGAEVLMWPADGGPPRALPGDAAYKSIALELSPSDKWLLVDYMLQDTPIYTGPWKQILWDMHTLEPVREWIVGKWVPHWFSRDESWLLAYSLERETPYPGVARWNLEDGQVIPLGSPHREPPSTLRFPPIDFSNHHFAPSEDLEWLVSWKGQDLFVSRIGENSLGDAEWLGHQEESVLSASTSPHGDLISSSSHNQITIWTKNQSGRSVASLPTAWASGTFDIENGRLFTSWPSRENLISFHDLRGPVGSRGTPLLPAEFSPGYMDISPGGDWLVLTGWPQFGFRETYFYNMRAVWPFHIDTRLADTPASNCIRFSNDHRKVALINEGRVLFQHLSSDAFPTRIIYESPGNLVIYILEFDPGDDFLLVGTHRDGASLVPLDGGSPQQLENAPSFTAAAAFSPSGQLIAVGGGFADLPPDQCHTRVMDLEGRVLGRIPEGGNEEVRDIKFIRENELVISSAGGLRLWNMETNQVRVLRKGGHGNVAVSKHFILANDAEGIWLYEFPSLKVRKLAMPATWSVDVERNCQPLAISPDERFVVTRESRGTLCVQYVDDDRYHLLPSNDAGISDIWIGGKGFWIGAINYEGKLSYWPVPRGEPLHDRPLEEFLAILKAQTNIRAFIDLSSERGYRYESEPFPGWETTPVWQEWYSPEYMEHTPWDPVVDLASLGVSSE